MNIAQLLSGTVARHGGREAVVKDGRRATYGELGQAVAAVAALLADLGIGPGERLALLMANAPGYLSACFGALAAGAVVVPLNPASRAREVARTVSHCGAKALIVERNYPDLSTLDDLLPGVLIRGIDPEELDWAGPGCGKLRPRAAEAGEPAMILYTSGTTGEPKGVTLSHGNLLNNGRAITEYLKLGPDDSIVSVLPFHYSYGNSVLHTHMAVGAKLVIENGMRYPARVLGLMESERVSGFSGVPSTYALLMSRCRPADYRLDALRYLTQAGGAMAPALAQQVGTAFPQAELFVMYGQTEATARLTYLPPAQLASKPGSVGVPVRGVRIDIRNDAGMSLPSGLSGEVWVRGRNIMLGYWRDPNKTAEVISGGWLRTGDLGYRDRDGYLFLQGRRDDIIKSGAHRISPYEIEEVISQLPQVEEVAVTGVDDEILGQVVKAVIVPKPGAAIDSRAVCRHCLERLPPFKVPKQVEFVAALPKTASGKVKRFLLGDSNGGRDKDVRCAVQ